MTKRILRWVFVLLFLAIIIGLSIEESRAFMLAFLLRVLFFVKRHLLAMLATFFLVKGKFVLILFFKKIILLSVTGLGKRYVVEKVVMGNLKTHFLDYLKADIAKLVQHAKKNFKSFPLVKKMITILAFLGSLGFVGKFMGGMLAVKVFVAKVWSFLLAIFLKVGAGVIYFFTDYVWNSWLAPIIELVVFSWLLSILEKVPFLAKGFKAIYYFFREMFSWLEELMAMLFHRRLQRFLAKLVKYIQKHIYKFIGYKRVSLYAQLKERRTLASNGYEKVKEVRQKRKKRVKKSLRDKRLENRKGRKRLRT